MKKFYPILFLLCFSLTFFFSCSNAGDDGENQVSYTIDEKTWNETMKGLPFIKSSTSKFTYKYYDIWNGNTSLEEIVKKEGLKLDGDSILATGSFHSMWDFSDFASSGKSKKYVCYTERYGGKWLYWYFEKAYDDIAYDFINVGEELIQVFVDEAESLFPSFDNLTFENNTYSCTFEDIGEFHDETYRFDFVFENSNLASVKVWYLDEEIAENTSDFELIRFIEFSDWGETKVELPDTHSLDEMDFDELEDYLFTLAYDLGKDRFSICYWDSDATSAYVEVVYSGLVYYEYNEEEDESYYKIKKEDRIRKDVIKYFIENNIAHYADVEDLSEQITEADCVYLGRFKDGNQYYIEIIEEQAFSQADETAPIFTIRVRNSAINEDEH